MEQTSICFLNINQFIQVKHSREKNATKFQRSSFFDTIKRLAIPITPTFVRDTGLSEILPLFPNLEILECHSPGSISGRQTPREAWWIMDGCWRIEESFQQYKDLNTAYRAPKLIFKNKVNIIG
jgi:hypothetical protein